MRDTNKGSAFSLAGAYLDSIPYPPPPKPKSENKGYKGANTIGSSKKSVIRKDRSGRFYPPPLHPLGHSLDSIDKATSIWIKFLVFAPPDQLEFLQPDSSPYNPLKLFLDRDLRKV